MAGEEDYLEAERLLKQGRIDEGVERLHSAVDAGSSTAMARLAQYLLHFDDASGAQGDALELLRRAHTEGSAPAAYLLAMLAVGDADSGRAARVAELIEQASGRGHGDAMRARGLLLAEHRDATIRAAGLELLARSAQAGDALSVHMLAAHRRAGAHRAGSASDAQLEAGLRQSLEALFAPPPIETLAHSPLIARAPDLLGAGLCYYLCCFALPHLRSSAVHDPREGTARHASLRTSSDASIDPLQEDLVLRIIQSRMAAAAALPLAHAEHLVVLRYRPGEEYRPHRDTLGPSALAADRPQAGQRIRTVCAYLNPVPAGGETDFPLRGIRVAPQPGAAVVFDNLDDDAKPAESSLHAGLPVRAGEKWLATLWLRSQPYRRF